MIVHRSFDQQQVDIAIDKIQEAKNLKKSAVAKKAAALPRVNVGDRQQLGAGAAGGGLGNASQKPPVDTQAAAIAF